MIAATTRRTAALALVPALALSVAFAPAAFAQDAGTKTQAQEQTAETPDAETDAPDVRDIEVPEDRVTTFTLDNGLQVVVLPDRRAPVVTQMIYYKVGAADEAPGESGVAHFLEHLMFKGTSNYPEGEFSRKVAEVGGQENAFTSDDYTGYYQQVASDQLEMIMTYEADRMSNLVLDEETVLPERDVILEERRMRVGNEPGAQLSEIVQATMFVNSPYGTPVIGWEDEIRSLTRDDAIAFYDKYYTPSNAILLIAGDVSVDEVRALVDKTYGKIEQRAQIEERDRPSEPEPRAERTVTLRDARVTQPSFNTSYLVPSETTAEDNEAAALDILSDVLGGGTTSRLYRDLIVEKGIAASAGTYYQSSALDDGTFVLYGTPRGGASLEAVEAATDAAITDLIENGITDEELERAKNRVRKSVIYLRDSQTAMAQRYATALATGRTIEDVEKWPERIEAVTVEDVNAVARKYLKPERSVTGYLLPEASETAEATTPADATGKPGEPAPSPASLTPVPNEPAEGEPMVESPS
ncbi:pitrilysin family protein [Fulvimarina sp. 2208YS6-2-32]|uniref:Pitrilysin family protein n=1 Tax=Fulvimarina uroteuthidis TaxID=3098149 RepID=A0ABU5I3H9_9HYPH|nr:pitrilysin family protein [Fulvimarina sp. 2208YS6-2-32]MDY8109328.1 pitrilysin family protein [Fulvimarina sp. 2208YS6-2-32]